MKKLKNKDKKKMWRAKATKLVGTGVGEQGLFVEREVGVAHVGEGVVTETILLTTFVCFMSLR